MILQYCWLWNKKTTGALSLNDSFFVSWMETVTNVQIIWEAMNFFFFIIKKKGKERKEREPTNKKSTKQL